jgi:hypothetical protein
MGITNALSLSRFQSPRQELSCCWVEFPNSAYGIAYHLKYPVTTKYFSSFIDGSAKTPTGRKFKWKTKHNSSSFECLLESLNLITIRYPVDTALLYIREIIEPGDLEYGLFVGGTRSIEASRLSEKQVSRLRIMILPKRREDILVSYLHQYKMLKFSSRFLSKVVKDFATFQQKYSKSTSLKEKFDLLFGFSYAIHKYSAWMYRYERSRSREKVSRIGLEAWRQFDPIESAVTNCGILHFVLLCFVVKK